MRAEKVPQGGIGTSPERGSRPRTYGLAVLLMLLAAFALRTWDLGGASLWIDEAWTDSWTHAPLVDSFEIILENGVQTPLYFTLLHFFPTGNEWLVRWPSALLGVIGVALMLRVIVELYGSYTMALVGAALVALNPYHIWLSRMARPYPLVFILALLVSYYFLKLLRGDRSRANWIGFTLSSMAAYMTHYYLLGLPLAQYILFAFILRGNRGFFRNWIKAQVVASIPLLIWVVALAQQQTVALGLGWIPRPNFADLVVTLWNMLVGYDGWPAWFVVPGLLSAALGLLWGMVVSIRRRGQDRQDFYWFWLIVAPLAAVFIASQFRPLYVDRYFMIFLPAVVILMVRGWQQLPRPAWRIGLAGLVGVACLGTVIVTLHDGTDQKEDWRAAAVFVHQNEQPGDGLLTESPIDLLAVLRYLGSNDLSYSWVLDTPDPLARFETPVSRVWAFYRNPREDGHRQGALPAFDPFAPSGTPMQEWLQPRQDQVLAMRSFNGVTVLLVNVAQEVGQ